MLTRNPIFWETGTRHIRDKSCTVWHKERKSEDLLGNCHNICALTEGSQVSAIYPALTANFNLQLDQEEGAKEAIFQGRDNTEKIQEEIVP